MASSSRSSRTWESLCGPWITDDKSLYSRTGTAPAPSKNFVQVYVTDSQVFFRIWKILPPLRADAFQSPTEMKCSYSEFADDERMRGEIERSLGHNELIYLDRLVSGHIDYLNRLPRKVLLRILFHMDLVSVSKLGQVNKLFRELCSCDALWSKIYMQHTNQPVTEELLMLVDQKGWRELFFMSKLQLQKHLRRQGEHKDQDQGQSREFFMTSHEITDD